MSAIKELEEAVEDLRARFDSLAALKIGQTLDTD